MAKIDINKLKDTAKTVAEKAGDFAGSAMIKAGEAAGHAGSAVVKTSKTVVEKAIELKDNIPPVKIEDILRVVMKVPIVQVDREKLLRKELIKYYPEETVELAIEKNPAFAGIDRDAINKIAQQVINFETNKVTTVSFAAGMPGGFAMAATIPADITQYFTFILRAMQKLAYLYGFPEFNFSEDEVDDDTLNHVLVFMGVMFGVQGANQAVKALARAAAQKVTKSLAQKALTKTTVYPIVKKIATAVGVRMTKQVFAENVGKVVPVVGGIVAGGLTYATFKPGCIRLKNSFNTLQLSDPEFYKNPTSYPETELIDAIDVDFEDLPDAEDVLEDV